MRLLAAGRARGAEGRRGLRPRHGRAARGHALPRRLRGALQGRARRAQEAAASRSCSSTRCTPWSARAPPPAAPWTSPTSSSPSSPRARSASSAPPPSRSSSTSRRTARWPAACRRSTLNEPTLEDTVKILRGPARAGTRSTTRSPTPTPPSRRAARLARRHLRDYRLPDSAIDVLDEAGAVLRLLGPPAEGETPGRRRAGDRAGRRPHGAHPREAGHRPPTASGCARWRSRCSAWCSARRRRSTPRPWPSSARARASASPTIPRAASCSPAPPASARPSSPSSSPCHLGNEFIRYDMSEYAEKHAVARLIGAPPGLRGVRAGRPAGGRRAPAPLLRGAHGRDREGAPRPVQHPAPGDGPRDPHRQHRAQGRLPPGHPDHDLQRGVARDEHGQHRLRRRPRRRTPRARAARRWRSCSAPSSGTASTPSSPSRP